MAQGGRRKTSETGTIIVGVHNKQRVQERFDYEDTIDLVLERFARQLKVDGGSISLLHQGSRLDRRATVKDVFISSGQASHVHIVPEEKRSALRVPNRSRMTGGLFKEKELYIFCKTCKDVVPGRPLLCCPSCNEKSAFERHKATPLGVEELAGSEDDLMGRCLKCGKDNVKATVLFECKAQAEGGHLGAFLKDVRYNSLSVICMKCGVRRTNDLVYVFNCSHRHVLCHLCFDGFCQWQLCNGNFKNFDEIGFSVACPATNCDQCPVLDPHHFYLCGEQFYKEYGEKAMQDYQTHGQMCIDCHAAMDYTGHSPQAQTSPTDCPVTPVTGRSWWLKRVFSRTTSTPPPDTAETQRRVRCTTPGCSRSYCANCRALWHEGECAQLGEDTKEFPIPDKDWMRESSWRQ